MNTHQAQQGLLVAWHHVDHPEARRELGTAAALESVATLAGANPWAD